MNSVASFWNSSFLLTTFDAVAHAMREREMEEEAEDLVLDLSPTEQALFTVLIDMRERQDKIIQNQKSLCSLVLSMDPSMRDEEPMGELN